MLFNSLNFAVFLPIVFVLYWFATKGSFRIQNFLLLVSSYFFYACWDWRFMFLLIFSTSLDYFSGIKIHESQSEKAKSIWLWLSISINLGFLGFFKYYNFFAASFVDGLSLLGFKANLTSIQIMLPIGISFYTFHGLSYLIDIYKSRIKPERNFIDYSLFVSFFPLLVAGPIERATHLLPQLLRKRIFDYSKAVNGLRQILWGLFKKIVIADNCAEYADMIFNNSDQYSGSMLFLGALLFTFQIYGDFSGYSDIALGTARLFGIDLLRNFAFPYFSRDMAEFWRRWHISLSSWFKDYLYIPLGGSKGSTFLKVRNTFIIFIVSGLWHGANWTFVVWGLLNALYIMPSIITNKNRNNLEIVAKGRLLPSLKDVLSIGLTFCLTVFAWIFFRVESLDHAWHFVKDMFVGLSAKIGYIQTINLVYFTMGLKIPALILVFIMIEWFGREQQYAVEHFGKKWSPIFRYAFYYTLIFSMLWFAGKEQQFIYFQF